MNQIYQIIALYKFTNLIYLRVKCRHHRCVYKQKAFRFLSIRLRNWVIVEKMERSICEILQIEIYISIKMI